jgi:hypothetical protein
MKNTETNSSYKYVDYRLAPVKEPSTALVAAFWIALGILLFASVAGAQASSQPVASAQNWEQQLLELAGIALMAGATWAIAQARAYFAAHAKSALAQYGVGVFTRLSAAALAAVQATQQVVNRDLAGGLTKATAANLKSDALALVKSQLGPAGIAELASIVGLDQVAQVLSTHVEAAVLQVNQAQAAPVASAKT